MVMGSHEGGRTWVQSQDLIVGEGQTEETHSEKGEMSDWRGSSFGVFPGLWTMACD
jgi:hypothetical protein